MATSDDVTSGGTSSPDVCPLSRDVTDTEAGIAAGAVGTLAMDSPAAHSVTKAAHPPSFWFIR
jgi:hypothetical protein